ncbi:MAG: hypothetical protein AAGC93_18435 [Cyanobacteria bacterium P01_F01_bin.53]
MDNEFNLQPESEQLTMLIARRALQKGTVLSQSLKSLDPDKLTWFQAHQIVVEKNLTKNSKNERSEKIREEIGRKLALIEEKRTNPNYNRLLTSQEEKQFKNDLHVLKGKVHEISTPSPAVQGAYEDGVFYHALHTGTEPNDAPQSNGYDATLRTRLEEHRDQPRPVTSAMEQQYADDITRLKTKMSSATT